jgi:hypothetical protein
MGMAPSRQEEPRETFGQQTPRRWGWGTPLKKRPAARTNLLYFTHEPFVKLSTAAAATDFRIFEASPSRTTLSHLLILIRHLGIGNPPSSNVLRNGDQLFGRQFVLKNGKSATERFCVKSS